MKKLTIMREYLNRKNSTSIQILRFELNKYPTTQNSTA